jgi:hypothetical protein
MLSVQEALVPGIHSRLMRVVDRIGKLPALILALCGQAMLTLLIPYLMFSDAFLSSAVFAYRRAVSSLALD